MIGIDSDAIIDFLKGNEKIRELVEKYSDELITTHINVFEVFFGAYRAKIHTSEALQAAVSFFNAVEVIPFGEGQKAAKTLAELYDKGEALDQNDVLIATALLARGCTKILTKNTKHFSKIKGLQVVAY